MRKRGLGKGLHEMGVSELLSVASATLEPSMSSDLITLSIDALQPGKYQPRRTINPEALDELANSIRSQGIIQPLVVRKVLTGYEIIAGERRWRAAKLAGLTDVPVIVRELDDQAALAISLIENIQRQELNVIDEALALQRLIDEFHMTHQDVAMAVGRSRASVTNLLRLLKLTPPVLSWLEKGQLDMGHARALLSLEGQEQNDVAELIINRGLSVREAENWIRKLHQKKTQNVLNAFEPTLALADVKRLQNNLSQFLGTLVSIKQANKGRGKVVIQYKNMDQLNEILERIGSK